MYEVTTWSTPSTFKKEAAAAIRSGTTKVAGFSIKGFTFLPAELSTVAGLVEKAKIKIRYMEKNPRFSGAYDNISNTIYVEPRAKGVGEAVFHSTLVHEAVHAAFDVQGGKAPFSMHAHLDEAAAHIAQAMFLRRCGVLISELVGNQYKCVQAAWHPAADLLAKRAPSRQAMSTLMDTIGEWYENKTRTKNGIK